MCIRGSNSLAGGDQCERRFRALDLQKLHIAQESGVAWFARADISGLPGKTPSK